jgi:hypothetical protein
MSLSKEMLVYIVLTRFFYGNIENTYKILKDRNNKLVIPNLNYLDNLIIFIYSLIILKLFN